MKNTVLSILFVLVFFAGIADATYTDYIGAGHGDGVTVTACSEDDGIAVGQNTVNGSGLSGPSGTHDTDWANHWLSVENGTAANPNPARSTYGYWIKYDFGEVYNLSNMWVWNYNEQGVTSRGPKNVIIDYSTDGSSWTELTATQFSEATGSGSYAGFTNPDLNFNNAPVRYVLISVVDNWAGSEAWAGLAEIKFNITSAKASSPNPYHTETGIHPEQDLSWTSGSGATSHKVYFGTDPTPDSGEFQDNQTETTFDPCTMAYNTTYYWRIDEVDGGTTTGDVWRFTTGSNKAENPYPADTATDRKNYILLTWDPSVDAVSHDVYFGTDPTPDSGESQGSQSETMFNPGVLEYETTYYWRIDEYNGSTTFSGDVWSFTTGSQPPFAATGRTSPYQAPPPEPTSFPAEEASVDVTFDRLPTKMRFVMASFPSIVSENDMHYNSGYLETYDPERAVPLSLDGNISWEACADHDVQYNRMWIESQNDARILVKVIAAMKLQADYDLIAHTDYYSGSPWGDHCTLPPGVTVGYGDWSEEYYYIYPDGTHTRYAKCYTPFAEEPGLAPFGFDRWPPNYIYEFFEGTIFVNDDQEPTDVFDPDKTLTLIRMNGDSQDIAYLPNYPEDFGSFDNANIVVVGLKSIFRPFIIGMPTNIQVQPYGCDGCTEFIRWGGVTPWGHMINYDIYEITSNTIAQVYLQGVTDAEDPSSELSILAKSWVNPPSMTITGSGYTGGTYERKERAYKATNTTGGLAVFRCNLHGSFENPIVNPVIVLNDWGPGYPQLAINGAPYTEDYRYGYEGNNMVIWIGDFSSTSTVDIEVSYEQSFSGGTGAPADPFRLETPNDINQLALISFYWNSAFELVNDINLSALTNLNTIGHYQDELYFSPFSGIFDGNNHTLSNLVMNEPNGNSTALFGYVNGPNAVVKNLHLTDVNILGAHYVGSLIGKLTDGSVTNCSVQNALVSGTSNTGGLLGHLENADLSDCFFRGTVLGRGTTNYNIGGLVGHSDGGSMVNACAEAVVTSVDDTYKIGGLVGLSSSTEITTSSAYAEVNAGLDSNYVGGLIGTNHGSVSNSYAAGSVSGNDSVGGLTGYNGVGRGGPSGGTLYNCYAAANVSGTTNLGGFTGQDTGTGDYTACFWDADLNPTLDGIGNTAEPNVMDKTTTQMQTETTFTDYGWDFSDVWAICEGTNYPQLLYQFLVAPDYFCPEGVDFMDYGFFADRWLMTDCHLTDDCNSTDLDASGTVDFNDLNIFNSYWLFGKQ